MSKNWKTYKIKEIALSMADAPFGSNLKTKDYVDIGIPVIQGKNINGRNCEWTGNRYVDKKKFFSLPRHWAKVGSLIFPKVGTIGKVGILTKYKNYTQYLLSTNTMMLEVDPEIAYRDFVYYYFTTPRIVQDILAANSNSVQPVFNFGALKEYPIILPPLQEQKAIASILSALDDKIELNLQMNKTLEEMAMALYKHWFVDFGPFQNEKFISSELGEIPEGWEVITLGELIELNPKLKLKKGIEASFVEMKALPIDVMSVSEVAFKEYKGGAKFQNGDTLFARITPCLENGKTAFVDFLKSGKIAFGSTEFLVMRAKEGVSKYWTYCLARDTNFRNFAISTMVGTSGRQRVQNDPFLSYKIPQPPKEIFDSFSEKAEPWFTQIRLNTVENQTLTKLRDTLLPKLISGEVRIKQAVKILTKAL